MVNYDNRTHEPAENNAAPVEDGPCGWCNKEYDEHEDGVDVDVDSPNLMARPIKLCVYAVDKYGDRRNYRPRDYTDDEDEREAAELARYDQ